MNPDGQIWNQATKTWNLLPTLPKPSYYSSDAKTIVVPATSTKPFYISLSTGFYKVTKDIRISSLDAGSLAANTPYYVYLVSDSEGVLSKEGPDTGPKGYEAWTYLGAAATRTGAAEFGFFRAANGTYLCSRPIEEETRASGAGRGSAVFASMPLTVAAVYVCLRADVDGAGSADFAELASTDTSVETMRVENNGTAGFDGYTYGWLPIFTEQTLWLTPGSNSACDVELLGWQEEPWRYQ